VRPGASGQVCGLPSTAASRSISSVLTVASACSKLAHGAVARIVLPINTTCPRQDSGLTLSQTALTANRSWTLGSWLMTAPGRTSPPPIDGDCSFRRT
jgi:hypothetical protein